MSKNNKLLIILFVLLLVALFIVNRVTDPRERRITFFDVEEDEVSAFQFTTEQDTLKIARGEREWYIEEPFYFLADNSRVDTFLESVFPVETSTTPVSESEASHKEYLVTADKGALLSFYDGNQNLLDEAYIGRKGRMVFARRPQSDKVFQLRGQIGHLISANVNAWRENRVLAIPHEVIEQIDVEYRRNTYTISTVNGTSWHYEDAENEFPIEPNNRALKRMLSQLEEIPSLRFIDFQYEEFADILNDPELVVDITKTDGSTTGLVFGFDREQGDFVVKRDGNKDHMFMVKAETADKFTISWRHFKNDFEGIM